VNHTGIKDDGVLQNRSTCFYFPVHQVLHNVGQETVYETYCRDVVQGAIDGINGSIMTYGQTGSGKTFTMVRSKKSSNSSRSSSCRSSSSSGDGKRRSSCRALLHLHEPITNQTSYPFLPLNLLLLWKPDG